MLSEDFQGVDRRTIVAGVLYPNRLAVAKPLEKFDEPEGRHVSARSNAKGGDDPMNVQAVAIEERVPRLERPRLVVGDPGRVAQPFGRLGVEVDGKPARLGAVIGENAA